MKVKIPFKPRFRETLLDGTKTWTSRTKQYGQAGDTFEVFGHNFLIEGVHEMQLLAVARFWRQEGCKSREDFIQVWKQIHPRKGFVPSQRVYVHVFKRSSL